jgi:membrane fusion protein, heavy metal efflux system
MNKRINKIAICFIATAILAGITYLFLDIKDHEKISPADQEEEQNEYFIPLNKDQLRAANILIETTGPGNLQPSLHAFGKIILNNKNIMHVTANSSGIVKKVPKNVGDSVLSGDLLAVLESREIAEAKSSFMDSFKKNRQAQVTLEREQRLYDTQISAAQDYQNALVEAEKSQMELELSQQKLLSSGISLSEIFLLAEGNIKDLQTVEIRSPLSGVVVYRDIAPGRHVDGNHEAFIIADLNVVDAEFRVFPKDLPLLAKGLDIELNCPGGFQAKGKITSISPVFDEETHSVTAIATIHNEKKELKPGMFLCADIKGKKEPAALLVPKEALQKIDNDECLFIAKDEGFEIRKVKTGRCDGKQIEILSGIIPGEPYASTNTFILKAEHGKDSAQHMD